MKRLFLCLGLLLGVFSCQKEEPEQPAEPKEPVIIYERPSERHVVCYPKGSGIKSHRSDHIDNLIPVGVNDSAAFARLITHIPKGVSFVVEPFSKEDARRFGADYGLSFFVDDSFDWSSTDNCVETEYRDYYVDYKGNPKIYVYSSIYQLKKPEITVEAANGYFVHEMARDSLFFDFNGRAFERPSPKTNSWMCRFWSQRYGVEFDIKSNCPFEVKKPDWVSADLRDDNVSTFRVDTNKVHTGSHRVGFIEFIDQAGRVHRRLKVVQERADWFDRQYEVLMEIGNALFTKEELEERTWGDKERIQEVVSGHWPPLDHPWDGVDFTDDGHINEFYLSLGSGVGPIPESIGELWYLSRIEFSSFKNLTGPIPQSLGYLPIIHHISISGTSITGTIPESFLEIPCLVDLDLYDNKLSGPIPEWIYTLPNLRYLWLGLNNFDNQPGTGNLLDKQ